MNIKSLKGLTIGFTQFNNVNELNISRGLGGLNENLQKFYIIRRN